MKNWQKIGAMVLMLLAGGLLVWEWIGNSTDANEAREGNLTYTGSNGNSHKKQYYSNQGYVFGTYYNFRYEHTHDMESEIQAALQSFDSSLSMFNNESTISKLNRNESDEVDSLFLVLYETAREVSELTDGAFDITVRPLVNAWGFGQKKDHQPSAAQQSEMQNVVDSLRQFVGYELISVEKDNSHHGRLIKSDPRVTLDASAIAKGFGVDVVANLLREVGCENYLVDIGGEVVAHGLNDKHHAWRVGISTPVDDPDGTKEELQDIIETKDIAMATSGNYRQFYMDGDVRRSHTIDPRTGYPVQHNLLSATVVASSCMRADALATACMVLGAEKGIHVVEQTEDAMCYLIISIGNELKVVTSSNWNATTPIIQQNSAKFK